MSTKSNKAHGSENNSIQRGLALEKDVYKTHE